jgi:hypothetical protein
MTRESSSPTRGHYGRTRTRCGCGCWPAPAGGPEDGDRGRPGRGRECRELLVPPAPAGQVRPGGGVAGGRPGQALAGHRALHLVAAGLRRPEMAAAATCWSARSSTGTTSRRRTGSRGATRRTRRGGGPDRAATTRSTLTATEARQLGERTHALGEEYRARSLDAELRPRAAAP